MRVIGRECWKQYYKSNRIQERGAGKKFLLFPEKESDISLRWIDFWAMEMLTVYT